MFLSGMLECLMWRGVRIKVAYDAICPWLVNGIFVEDDKTAFVVTDMIDDADNAECDKIVNTKRFVFQEELRAVRREIRYAEKLSNSALEGALHALSEVSVYHFLLEDIYKNAMDFKSLGEYTSDFLAKIFK